MSASAVSSTDVDAKPLPAWLAPGLIVVGLATGLASEPVISAYRERFTTAMGLPPFPPELLWKVFWDKIYNHSICYGFLGLMLVGLIGAVAGFTHSPTRGVLGLVVGAVVGLVSGAFMGIIGWLIMSKLLGTSSLDSMLQAVIIFIPFWFGMATAASAVALFAAKRLDLASQIPKSAIIYPTIATIIYVAIITVLFPSDWPGQIIHEFTRVRLVLQITGCVGVALAVFTLLRAKSPTKEVAGA